MAQVTYRGVQYDTETRLQSQKVQQPQQEQLVYRGVAVKGGKQMLTVIEILAASVVFLTIIYAETQLLYNYK